MQKKKKKKLFDRKSNCFSWRRETICRRKATNYFYSRGCTTRSSISGSQDHRVRETFVLFLLQLRELRMIGIVGNTGDVYKRFSIFWCWRETVRERESVRVCVCVFVLVIQMIPFCVAIIIGWILPRNHNEIVR
jgi:hypothetical protein